MTLITAFCISLSVIITPSCNTSGTVTYFGIKAIFFLLQRNYIVGTDRKIILFTVLSPIHHPPRMPLQRELGLQSGPFINEKHPVFHHFTASRQQQAIDTPFVRRKCLYPIIIMLHGVREVLKLVVLSQIVKIQQITVFYNKRITACHHFLLLLIAIQCISD